MRAALILSVLMSTAAAGADLYSWVDGKGVTHYSSTPPAKSSAKTKVTVLKGGKVSLPSPAARPKQAAADSAAAAAAPSASAPGSRVELFTTSWCPHCREARDYLKSRGIAYQDYDVEKDREAYARYQGYGGGGVPVAVIDGAVLRGFSPDLYNQALSVPAR